jgi:uncharacterized membrane protein YgcG
MLAVLLAVISGCGATKSRTATEQLLMSDAVDRAVARIDFKDLAGQQVFFDTKFVVNTKDPAFIGNLKGLGYVNAEYVISSLRQQMVAADLRLVDKVEDADFVVEARLGAVGVDNNEIVYGLPANNGLSGAASLVSNGPPIPSIPELSVARKIVQVGAAKIGVFAYNRRTREPVWQAGISQATSNAKDTWVLGVGPFQQGTIYRGSLFAGTKLQMPAIRPEDEAPAGLASDLDPLRGYAEEMHFQRPAPKDLNVKPAGFHQPDSETPPTGSSGNVSGGGAAASSAASGSGGSSAGGAGGAGGSAPPVQTSPKS